MYVRLGLIVEQFPNREGILCTGVEGPGPDLAVVKGNRDVFRSRRRVHQAYPGPPLGVRGYVGYVDIRRIDLSHRRDRSSVGPLYEELRISLDRAGVRVKDNVADARVVGKLIRDGDLSPLVAGKRHRPGFHQLSLSAQGPLRAGDALRGARIYDDDLRLPGKARGYMGKI